MRGYLGIDNGTQGLSVIFCDEETMAVVATGESSYDMVADLHEGFYEQLTSDWDKALGAAMKQIHEKIQNIEVLGIGISGQMHGEVLVDKNGKSLGSVRLWCDSRNDHEGTELTQLFGTKVPKRSTCARFLWTIRNRREIAVKTHHITTPAGWIHYRITGKWILGIGDASGMFPVDQSTLDYDNQKLQAFDALVKKESNEILPLQSILPEIRRSGEAAGCLNDVGAELLGLPAGVPVAAAEGDQPAAMAGSLIAEAGMTSMSFGTSVVANAVGDRPFQGVHAGVDQFCAADGKPINMIWIRNGTTFINTIVKMYANILGEGVNGFDQVMPKLIQAEPDCGGLLALPFMDDEPGLSIKQGGTALVVGLTTKNATAGNLAKAALLSSMFNLKLGTGVLDQQGYPRSEIILSGGLAKTSACGQIVSDVFNCPVTLLDSGEEGSAWGAALLGKYRHTCVKGNTVTWESFVRAVGVEERTRFEPNLQAVLQYEKMFERYKKLIALNSALYEAISS